MWVHLLAVLLAIFFGGRLKGLALGTMGGLCLCGLTFIGHLKPGAPPVDVMLAILSVVLAASAMERAGGVNYLIVHSERMIRRYPEKITWIAPIVSYVLTVFAGTGHIMYALLPIIAEVARETGVRPERPLGASVISSQLAATAGPVSPVGAIMVLFLGRYGVSLQHILAVSLPATFLGTLATCLVSSYVGEDIAAVSADKQHAEKHPLQPYARLSFAIFLTGIGSLVALGIWPHLLPSWPGEHGGHTVLGMNVVLELVMLSVAALILWLCRVDAKAMHQSPLFVAGVQAVIAIFGLAWLGDTFFQSYSAEISALAGPWIRQYPWLFGVVIFGMSMMLFSQSATLRALVPLGLSLGVSPMVLVALIPASSGIFFIPSYPTLLAAMELDTTNSTRVGRFVLNHSFMLPGLVGVCVSVLVGFWLVR